MAVNDLDVKNTPGYTPVEEPKPGNDTPDNFESVSPSIVQQKSQGQGGFTQSDSFQQQEAVIEDKASNISPSFDTQPIELPDFGAVLKQVAGEDTTEAPTDNASDTPDAPDAPTREQKNTPETSTEMPELKGYNSVLNASLSYNDLGGIASFTREAARTRGLDPDVSVKVAKSEGLSKGGYRAKYKNKSGKQEPSYGPFQLLVGGEGTGYPTGLGNEFIKKTGRHPSDPGTIKQQIEFALDYAKENGWSAWYGAAKAGVGKWTGIKGS